MISFILRGTARLLTPLLLAFSLFLLVRGHGYPGGGFVGGLVAASALVLHGLAYRGGAARSALRADPRLFVAAGLLTAAGSGLPALVRGEPFLAGRWARLDLGGVGLDLGTPLIFDAGVYLVVLGATMAVLLPLLEEQ
ncbi:MAG: Na+/H+ antiporter subunit B [Halobacteria archaeon]